MRILLPAMTSLSGVATSKIKWSGWCRYQPKELIVTENGFSVKGEASKALADVLNDTERVNFYRGYVNAAIDAVEQDQVTIIITRRQPVA